MKKFNAPELEIAVFAIEDVITVSSGGDDFIPPEAGENQTPYG